MAKRIRVYDLAKSLGLSNKGAFDLCNDLGMGIKSPSSSIEEAQADRARRKIERDGFGSYERAGGGEDSHGHGRSSSHSSSEAKQAPQVSEAVTASPATKQETTEAKAVSSEASPAEVKAKPLGDDRDSRVAKVRAEAPASVVERPKVETPAAAVAEERSAPAKTQSRTPDESVSTEKAVSAQQSDISGATATEAAPAAPRDFSQSQDFSRTGPIGNRRVVRYSEGRSSAPRDNKSETTSDSAPSLENNEQVAPPSRPRVPLSLSGKPIPPPPGGFNRGPRPDGQGGQGGYNRGPRPDGQGGQGGQGGYNRGPRTDGPGGQGGFTPRTGGSFGGARGSTPPPPSGAPFGLKGGPQRGSRPVSKSARRRSKKANEELEPTQVANYIPSNAPVPDGEVIVERGSTAQEIGPKFNRSAGDVVRFLFLQGELVTATQSLSDDAIELFAAEIGAQVKLVDPGQEQEAELYAKYFSADDDIDDEDIEWRAPVVTVMGHVDHGKTKLLDRIRETNVVAKEAGGITQHIGAYRAMVDDRFVTFIDTPGHEAFTQMRARGAGVTDIVVLVVAADDGVMPQTLEAIDHAKAAKVPIVVAINKIDKADADPTRVMQQLSEHGLIPEAWGGDTITVEVSALQNLGVDDLLEQLVVLAEVLELRASKTGKAKGVVLEANLDPGRGPVATVIVQQGTLHVGDPLVAGVAFGRVKALIDEAGRPVKEAEPSTPVQVLGFSEVPSAGDEFRETDELSVARQIGSMREQRQRIAGYTAQPGSAPGAKLEDLFEQIKRGETATLNVIIKADVQGSLEAVTESLRKLERPEVRLSIVRRAVGGINENDISLGAASNALIIGFNVRPDRRAREAAEAQHVEIRTYEIIYKMLEDIEAAMVGILAPEYEEVVTGDAEVREIFRVPKIGAVAGCYVQSGVITRGSKVRFLREGVVIWKGSITSLRRFKDDVREVAAGFECGIGLSDFQDLRSGDTIETFEDREIPRS